MALLVCLCARFITDLFVRGVNSTVENRLRRSWLFDEYQANSVI